MKFIEHLHQRIVIGRRTRVLSDTLAQLLPTDGSVLDVGCGDGQIDKLIQNLRPDVSITGVELLPRNTALIPVEKFDGQTLPFADGSFDVVMFVDVLHHTDDPMILLREAVRVSRHMVVIKDHTRDGWLAGPTLRFMDRVGNRRFGVPLPFNYWSGNEWRSAIRDLGLQIDGWTSHLGLYPWPASLLFDRSLHFVTRLTKS